MKKATIPMSLMRETIIQGDWISIQFQGTFQNLWSWIWSSGLSTFPCSCHRAGSMDFHSHIHHQTSHQHRSHCCGSPGGLHCAHSLGDFSSCADWSWQHCIHTVHTPPLLPCLQTHKHAAQMITYQIISQFNIKLRRGQQIIDIKLTILFTYAGIFAICSLMLYKKFLSNPNSHHTILKCFFCHSSNKSNWLSYWKES